MLEMIKSYAWLINMLADLIVLIGAPIAVLNYVHSEKQKRMERQYGTYDALDDKYIDFQKMCLSMPYLNVFDIDDELHTELTPIQKKEEIIAYSILMAIFERAFIMYKERDEYEGNQWEGWLENIEDYCRRENFVIAWEKNGWGWDTRFENLITGLIQKNFGSKRGNIDGENGQVKESFAKEKNVAKEESLAKEKSVPRKENTNKEETNHKFKNTEGNKPKK